MSNASPAAKIDYPESVETQANSVTGTVSDIQLPPVRMVLATFGPEADALFAPLLAGTKHTEHHVSGAARDEMASLEEGDFLVALLDGPAAVEPATAALGDARHRGVLTFVFAPRALHGCLPLSPDILANWSAADAGAGAGGGDDRSSEVIVTCMDAIAQMMRGQGLPCVDYLDVRCIVHDGGPASVVVSKAEGADRGRQVVRQFEIRCSALAIDSLSYCRALVSVRAGSDISLEEFTAVTDGLDALLPGIDLMVSAARFDPERTGLELAVLLTGQPESVRPKPLELVSKLRRHKSSVN